MDPPARGGRPSLRRRLVAAVAAIALALAGPSGGWLVARAEEAPPATVDTGTEPGPTDSDPALTRQDAAPTNPDPGPTNPDPGPTNPDPAPTPPDPAPTPNNTGPTATDRPSAGLTTQPAPASPANPPAMAWEATLSSTDLRISVAQSTAQAGGLVAGAEFTYTAAISHQGGAGSVAADGATFALTLPGYVLGVSATCEASAGTGAQCPESLSVATVSTTIHVTGEVPVFPLNGELVITVTGTLPTPVSGNIATTSMTCSATVTPPQTVTEADSLTNSSQVSTPVDNRAQVVVSLVPTWSATPNQYAVGAQVQWTATWTNNGPAAIAFQPRISDSELSSGTFAPTVWIDVDFTDCSWNAPAGWDACPVDDTDHVLKANGIGVFATAAPTLVFPPGASLTVSYTVTIGAGGTGIVTCGSAYSTSASVSAVLTSPAGSNNLASGSITSVSNAVTVIRGGCPTGDVSVTTSLASPTTWATGDAPRQATINYRAATGADASGAHIYAYVTSLPQYFTGGVAIADITCTWGGTAAGQSGCPDGIDPDHPVLTPPASGTLYTLWAGVVLPQFPAGATLTISYTIAPLGEAVPQKCGTTAAVIGSISASISAPNPWMVDSQRVTETNVNNNSAASTNQTLPRPACQTVDIQVTKTAVWAAGNTSPPVATWSTADPVRVITVTYTNASPLDVDDAVLSDTMFTLPSYFTDGLTIHFTGCVWNDVGQAAGLGEGLEADGGDCPVPTADRTLAGTGTSTLWSGISIGAFPAGAALTITYQVTPIGAVLPSYCGTGTLSLGTFQWATIALPPTWSTTHPDNPESPTTNNSAQTAASITRPPCPPPLEADLAVSWSQTSGGLTPGEPVTYTATWSNLGPEAADNAGIVLYYWNSPTNAFSGFLTRPTVSGITCTWTPDPAQPPAACPISLTSLTNFPAAPTTSLSTKLPTFPAGAVLEISYTLTLAWAKPTTCGSAGTGTFNSMATVAVPAAINGQSWHDAVTTNNSVTAPTKVPHQCADLVISKATSGAGITQAGAPIDFTLTISSTNSTSPVWGALVTDPLPSEVEFVAAECVPAPGTLVSACADSDTAYDPATHTVSAIIPAVGANEQVIVTIRALAGNVRPGSFYNSATVGSGPVDVARGYLGYYELNATSNTSGITFGIQNVPVQVALTKSIQWDSQTPATRDYTFSGTIVCQLQGSLTWTATIPIGSTSASATITRDQPDPDAPPVPQPAPPGISLWSGDECAVSEHDPPVLEDGVEYAGSAQLTSTGFTGPDLSFRLTPPAISIDSVTIVRWVVVLPPTGGDGTESVTLVGVALLVAAGLGLIPATRRRYAVRPGIGRAQAEGCGEE